MSCTLKRDEGSMRASPCPPPTPSPPPIPVNTIPPPTGPNTCGVVRNCQFNFVELNRTTSGYGELLRFELGLVRPNLSARWGIVLIGYRLEPRIQGSSFMYSVTVQVQGLLMFFAAFPYGVSTSHTTALLTAKLPRREVNGLISSIFVIQLDLNWHSIKQRSNITLARSEMKNSRRRNQRGIDWKWQIEVINTGPPFFKWIMP